MTKKGHAKVESTSQKLLRNSSNGCPQGHDDPKCRQNENCKTTCSVCDNNGECLECSKPGFQLPECNKPCAKEFFGLHCKRHCNSACLNAECDSKTGYCLACRNIGYSLPTCTLPCMPGTYGMHCQDQCPTVCKENCDRFSGFCKQCEVGNGPHCTVNCALLEHQDSCSLHCPEKCVGWCNTTHKKCSLCSPGFKVPHCREHCDTGTYGSQCNQNCSARCRDNVCNPITGECASCIDGYVGRWCNGKCIDGLYGPGCTMSCPETCIGHLCHAETGFCVKCQAGYTGHYCDKLCESGKYGGGCSTLCPSKCRWPCDPITGECHECMAGYRGYMCNSTCSKGSYGLSCNRTCPVGCLNDICHHETGDCAKCKNFFHGPRCVYFALSKTRPFEVVVYTVLSLLTPVVLLGAVMACYKRCSSKENKLIMRTVKMAEEKHIPKPRQMKEQRIRINKSDIQLIEESAKITTVQRGLRREIGVHKTQLSKNSDAHMMKNLKLSPLDRRSTTINAGENTKIQPTSSGEQRKRELIENETNEIKPDHIKGRELPASTGSSNVSRKTKLRASENPIGSTTKTRATSATRQMNKTKQTEERARVVTTEQDGDDNPAISLSPEENIDWQQATPSPRLAKEKGSVIMKSGSSIISFPSAELGPKKARQTFSGSSHFKNPKSSAVVSSVSRIDIIEESLCLYSPTQNVLNTQPELPPPPPPPHYMPESQGTKLPTPRARSQLQHNVPQSRPHMPSPPQYISESQRTKLSTPSVRSQSQQATSSPPLHISETQGTMLPHNRIHSHRTKSPSLLNMPQAQQATSSPPQCISESQGTMLPRNRLHLPRTKSPSLLNMPQSQQAISVPPYSVPESPHMLESQNATPKPPHSKPQSQHTMTQSLQNAPQSQDNMLSATLFNPDLQRTTSLSNQYERQSQLQMSSSSQNRSALQGTPSSFRENSPHTRNKLPSITHDYRSDLHRMILSSPQTLPQSQLTISASTQDEPQTQHTMLRSPQSTPEPQHMTQAAPQEKTQPLHTPGLYKPQSQLALSSTSKNRSQYHTMPSPPRSFLSAHSRTLSQNVKPYRLEEEQQAPSKPQSSSSLRPNNTLSSLLTMPTISNSWSGQQQSRTYLNPQGKSSTLTNISSKETPGSGHDKQLSPTSTAMLSETQDIRSKGMEQYPPEWQTSYGFPNDISDVSRDAKQPALRNNKDHVIQDHEPVSSSFEKEPPVIRSSIEEHLQQDTQEFPSSSSLPANAGSFSRRRARLANKEPEEPTKPKRPQSRSRSPGLVRCATTRVQVQTVSPENKAEQRLYPLPTPPAQGRAILKPVQKRSRHHDKASTRSKSSISDEDHAHSHSE
ncbi:hypothetical protein RRG08_054717 [Elysia crispata]|uniref:EGF-like domain-containing protein n=1 Tax=Elysia crispata TaxID=231223 RepID=A0AAE1E7X7_9GAST|nr:hypothetical protein RRG08_054717 [Elysia crispata]